MTTNTQPNIPIDIDELKKLAEKQIKHQQTLKQCIKNYRETHKNDEHYKEKQREYAKKHYENNKEKHQQKYLKRKWNNNIEVNSLMQISI